MEENQDVTKSSLDHPGDPGNQENLAGIETEERYNTEWKNQGQGKYLASVRKLVG